MAVIEQNPNVTLGDWRSDGNYATANRICTYADLVDKTLPVSGDVLHELGGSSNINNVYIINGRQTLTYLQLSHCEDLKVYLKTSSATGEQHMYRFNGEVRQLCRFSCKETDSLNGNVPYKYNLCVTVSDIDCIENTKEVRFRFKNITFRPCIKFIVGGSGVEWCSLVEVERENDLTNPHDIYIKMKNGLKAKFAIELYDSQSGSEYIYIGYDGYYGGSIKEYDSSYGGAVSLTYTSYDNIIPPVDWLANQTQEFIVEPYLENAQVTLTGTRNTPIYIEIETDSRFTVRNMTHAKFAAACDDTYENQAEYGVLSVIPGDYAGYFMTPIADPGHAYVTLMSQDVNQWDRFEGTVEEYDTYGNPTHEQPWEIKLQSFSPEVPSAWAWGPMNWGIEIHKKCDGEKFVHKYSYKLKLISKAAFYPTTVNVVEWRDLSIKYMPSETEIIDVSSQPSGQKWIHTFYTKETETPQNITLKAIVKSDSIEAGEMGYNATYAIVKVSLSTNQNNKLVSFDSNGGVGPGAYAVVPYVHSSSIMPRSLELYMRVLPNVTVNFMFPNGYQVQKEGGSYESGEPINAYYNTVQLQFDAETVQSEKITISIKRNQAGNHGYNYLTPSFYYNSSWTGGVALEVTFSGLAGKTFDVGQSTAVIANHVSFALGTTEFSIRFAGSQRSALALTFIIPSFRSGCLNNYAEVAPAADSTEIGGKGGYFGPMLVDQEQIEGSCAIYQGNSNELIVSVDGRPDSWIGATGYSYSFDISDTLIKIVPKTLSGVATIQNGYLPSTIYKEVTATGNDLTVESTPRTLTSSIYEPLTYSSTSPMFKFTINNGASAPAATLTAVKWSDTDIYIFSMNTVIEGESGYFDIRGITSGSEGTAGTKFNFSTTAASVPTSYSGSETNHLKYTFVLPDWFYGIKNGHKRTFRMDMNRSIWAGKQNTATGGTHLKGIEKYRIVAYREYNPNGSSGSQIFDKTLDCTGDYTEFRLDNLTTDENIFNIASNLGRPMALVIIPIEGEPLMNISGISWWNGTSMQSSTYNQDPVYLSPIMRENSIEINIKCKNASDVVKVSFDGTTFNSGYGVTVDDGHTVFATVEKLTGSSNTHKVTVWTDDDLYNYNDSLTGSKPYYTNKNIPIIIRYASSASPVDLTVNLTVGPVIDFEFYGPTYVSQNPATTSGTFTTKVLEYIKNGSNDNGILQTVYPSYPAYDPATGTDREETVYVPDQTNWVTKYDFKWCKWSGSGSSDTFTTYFLNPINGTVNGEYTLRSKDTFPGSEELIPTGTVDAFVEYTYHPLNNDAWYPNANSHKVTAQVQNYMSVAGIHFMTDPTHSSGYYHGAMSFSEAYMPPVFFTANPSAYTLKIYLAFVNPSELQLNTAVFKLGNGSTYTSEFETSTELNTDGTQIETTVGTLTYHRDWQLMVKVRIKSGVNLADVNDRICFQPSSSHPENARYWTGMQVPFELSIRKVVTSQTFNTSFSVPLGPVINMYTINDGKLEPSNNHIISTDGVIKPETGESHLVRIRAREWIHNGTTPWEASGYCGTINGRSYYVQFDYNDTEIPNYPTGNTGSPQRRLNTNFDINCPVNWTDINGNTYQPDGSPDWGAWKIDVINDSGLETIGRMDISMNISGGSEMKSWYPAKSMRVNVTEGFSVVGARYLKGIDKTNPIDWQLIYEDCSSNWQNGLKLMSIDANGQGAYSFEIFIAAPAGGSFYFDLITDVATTDSDFDDLFDVNVLVPSGGGTLPNGQHYDIIAYCNSYEDDFYILRRDYGLVGLYSDQVLQFKITGTPIGGSPIDETVNVTVCKFGLITNSLPSRMDGMVNSSETYDAYVDLVEMVNGTVQLKRYNANSTSVVKKSWEADGFTLDDYIMRTYNNSTNQYTLTVDQRIPYEYNSVISQMCINEPCYDLEDFSRYMTFKLTLYLNFYTTENPLGANFVLTPTNLSSGFFFYSSTPPSISNYTHTLTEMYKGSVKYYYATFIVESQSNGRNRIYRISQNGSPVQTGIWIASNTPDIQLTLLTITESGNVPYQYHYDNFITLRKNDPQAMGYPYTNMYTLNPMTNSPGAGPYKPIINWGFNQPIGGLFLSDKPFWDYSFIPS